MRWGPTSLHAAPGALRTRAGALGLTLGLTLGGCYSGAQPESGDASAGDTEATTGSGSASGSTGSASASAGSASAGESESEGDTDDAPPAFEPGSPVFPRLTESQYRNAITGLFPGPLPRPPLEPDTNPYLFYSIGAASTVVSESGVENYEEAANAIAEAVFADPARRDALLGCVPEAVADACVDGFLAAFGRRAYRRPLTEEERARWLGIASSLADGDPYIGVKMAVMGILQSPHFLYRVELGEADPEAPGRRRFTSYEMAGRLSFLIWNSGPDDELLDAAAADELLSELGITAQVQRMLDDPRARIAIQDFFAQFLDLGRLSGVDRDPLRYPLYHPALPEIMRTEVELLVDDLVYRQGGDIRELFTTRSTFVNSDLAALYGVDAPGATPITFVPVELPSDGPRAGLLTLGAFLTMNAHATETSPTLRGKYVRERVLCETVPPPPPGVNTDIPDDDGEAHTLRERLEKHRSDPLCAGCHASIDPPGFLFEHFDSVGNYRLLDNGYPIDASGDLDGSALSGARDLAERLKDDKRVGNCIVTQLYRHAESRLNEPQELPGLKAIQASFAESGYRFRDLILILATSEAYRTVAEEVDP
ncbi:MAG: DUF1592 domain-containing protein [Nannocystaceae bacterium]